MRRLKQTTTR